MQLVISNLTKSEVIITHVRPWKHKADSDTQLFLEDFLTFMEINAHPNDHEKYL